VKSWIIDTGPIVAYLDAQDPHHKEVAEVMDGFRGRLITTCAVVVEAMYFLSRSDSGAEKLVEFLILSDTEIHECTSPHFLSEAIVRMKKYDDTPMDFADATLILVAEHLSVYSVCTLDRRGFRTYRSKRGKPFRLVLDY